MILTNLIYDQVGFFSLYEAIIHSCSSSAWI